MRISLTQLALVGSAFMALACGQADDTFDDHASKTQHGQPGDDNAITTEVDCGGPQCLVTVVYHTPTAKARVMDLHLLYPESLTLVQSSAGQALDDADKQLTVQVPHPGELRLVAFSPANTQTIASGPIATLTFGNSDRISVADFQISQARPIFAPAEANIGLTVTPAAETRN